MKQTTRNTIAGAVGGVGVLLHTLMPLPLVAQESSAPTPPPAPAQGSRNMNYNPVVGQLTRAKVIQEFYSPFQAKNGSYPIIYVIDVDGDGRTTNDQKVYTPNETLQVGTNVQFIETESSITRKNLGVRNNVTKTH